MNYATIKNCDIANGPGVRVSLFVSGCTHRCKGCFNEVAWDFDYGEPFTQQTVDGILDMLAPDYVKGITLLGGEPFEPENQESIYKVLKAIKEKCPQKTVWCYSGFLFEELLSGTVGDKDLVFKCLELIDVLVDGKFVEALKSPSLLFRGSSNQRIIDVKKSVLQGEVIWLAGKWERQMGSGNIYEG